MNKYNAKPTTVDGIRFASQKEARRYTELMLLASAGEISDLTLQPVFHLRCGGIPVLIRSKGYPNGRRAKYVADFSYIDRAGSWIVEDTKGADTPVSRLKRALVEAEYNVQVILT